MAYAGTTDVQSEFKKINFADTDAVVSTSEVTEFIAQEEAALNAEVGTVYVVPITDSGGISLMKRMSVFMVKARVLDLLYVKTGNEKTDQGSGGEAYREIVRDMLDRIRKKELILSGAILAGSTGGVSSYSSAHCIDQVFKKDEQQW